jgi:dTDP-4-dehydrorhamnose 3,5-epimerase
MIDGIRLHALKKNCDERGFLMEVLRTDFDIYGSFAMMYVSKNYPGVIRAWHYHKLQDDFFCCLSGMIKVAAYDAREGSPTQGQVHEFFLGEDHPVLLKIPVGVYHGYKTIGTQPSLLVNFPTKLYDPKNPDEYRIAWDHPSIPYSWDIQFK